MPYWLYCLVFKILKPCGLHPKLYLQQHTPVSFEKLPMELVLVSGSHLVMGPAVEVPILGRFSWLSLYFGLAAEIGVDFCRINTRLHR